MIFIGTQRVVNFREINAKMKPDVNPTDVGKDIQG